ETEGRQIVLGVGEDGQMPVEVSHLTVVTLEGQIVIQMRGPRRKKGQLHLRHGMDLPVATTPCQPKPAQLNSSQPANHAQGSGGVSLRRASRSKTSRSGGG